MTYRHMGFHGTLSIGAKLGAGQSFQVIQFLISLPIKLMQHYNTLQSLGSPRHGKKDSIFFVALKPDIGVLKFKAKDCI
jgi:hypothetical protein